MARHSFSGAAVPTTVASQAQATDTQLQVAGPLTNWPNTNIGPFVVTVDRTLPTEEKVLISTYTPGSPATLNVEQRGYDGTSATTHQVGATVEHTSDATQFDLHDAFVANVGTVSPAASAVGDTGADGNSGISADALHEHPRESFAGTATTTMIDSTESPGTASTVSRGDHDHAGPGWSTGEITASAPGDTESDGTSAHPARANHKHAREALPTNIFDLAAAGSALPLFGTYSTQPLQVQFGVAIGTTDAVTGELTFSFPQPFSNGVIAVQMLGNGSNPAFIGVVPTGVTSKSGSACYVWEIQHPNEIDIVLGSSVTMTYIAWGF
jgi:hypothetical protein